MEWQKSPTCAHRSKTPPHGQFCGAWESLRVFFSLLTFSLRSRNVSLSTPTPTNHPPPTANSASNRRNGRHQVYVRHALSFPYPVLPRLDSPVLDDLQDCRGPLSWGASSASSASAEERHGTPARSFPGFSLRTLGWQQCRLPALEMLPGVLGMKRLCRVLLS